MVQHLAHELRQPLSAIENIAYYLRITANQRDERTLEQIEKLQRLVEHANWILDDAIHYLQAAAPQPVLVDVNELITRACGDESLAGAREARLLLADGLPLVSLDPAQGEHLSRSLVAFANKAGGPFCNLEIATGLSSDMVTLWAAFNACGLPKSDPRPLLEPFAAHLPGGSGLALASTRRIAEAHGGSVTVEMIHEGRLQVVVALPAAKDGCARNVSDPATHILAQPR
ncbi:MAG TPA: hypothetical protein DEH78_02515 [Solibacterales bacterium]|nr:hypothetical protein [Bryobacterales bacterium]